jgi:pyrimidine operon attenuation protein / uracil phosphoribosyltransferase
MSDLMTIPKAEDLYQQLLLQLSDQRKKEAFELVGLARGGVWVAERIAADLGLPGSGIINVSFHRDDYQDKGVGALNSAQGMATRIPFEVEGATVVVVDDVLDTGRTVRAALNELFDYGRPAKVYLAVLADRYRRELPVDASFKGARVSLPADQILVLERDGMNRFHFLIEPHACA